MANVVKKSRGRMKLEFKRLEFKVRNTQVKEHVSFHALPCCVAQKKGKKGRFLIQNLVRFHITKSHIESMIKDFGFWIHIVFHEELKQITPFIFYPAVPNIK